MWKRFLRYSDGRVDILPRSDDEIRAVIHSVDTGGWQTLVRTDRLIVAKLRRYGSHLWIAWKEDP